jgi:hypothetical protein
VGAYPGRQVLEDVKKIFFEILKIKDTSGILQAD